MHFALPAACSSWVRYSCFIEAQGVFPLYLGSELRPGANICTLCCLPPATVPAPFFTLILGPHLSMKWSLWSEGPGIAGLTTPGVSRVFITTFMPMCSLTNSPPSHRCPMHRRVMSTTPRDKDPWMLTAGGSTSAQNGCHSGGCSPL